MGIGASKASRTAVTGTRVASQALRSPSATPTSATSTITQIPTLQANEHVPTNQSEESNTISKTDDTKSLAEKLRDMEEKRATEKKLAEKDIQKKIQEAERRGRVQAEADASARFKALESKIKAKQDVESKARAQEEAQAAAKAKEDAKIIKAFSISEFFIGGPRVAAGTRTIVTRPGTVWDDFRAIFPRRNLRVEINNTTQDTYPNRYFKLGSGQWAPQSKSLTRYALSPELFLLDGTSCDEVLCIYTDGSFRQDAAAKTSFTGWAYDMGTEIVSGPMRIPFSGGRCTSVHVEMTAIFRALEQIYRSGECWRAIVIATDSLTSINHFKRAGEFENPMKDSLDMFANDFLLLCHELVRCNGLRNLYFFKVERDVVADCDKAAEWERLKDEVDFSKESNKKVWKASS